MAKNKLQKLTDTQYQLLRDAVERPVDTYRNKATIKALAKRGLMVKAWNHFMQYNALTDEAIALLDVTREQVNVNYARYWLLHEGTQIRHNVKQIHERLFPRGELYLDYDYYRRSLEEESEAVASWMERAIELARAEIRAGVAS